MKEVSSTYEKAIEIGKLMKSPVQVQCGVMTTAVFIKPIVRDKVARDGEIHSNSLIK